ncbi:prepilin-type N-terminal cleavage/methylation domain-containing protein [Ligilactobacillus aviarius]|uniref:prepilin-type N-terminal cleavage/methylation domain-containing protein n=1 Tax=Ligilactobacillus aviarius TaxID=1606 RepID=UPI00255B8500|nr:prepilin-type N-terminal cleavage/methylation domain-containing protein [Ligilactobacillus aviarius]
MSKVKKVKGFTLIEMAIVLFIISLLILIIIPNINHQRKNAVNVNSNAMRTNFEHRPNCICRSIPIPRLQR